MIESFFNLGRGGWWWGNLENNGSLMNQAFEIVFYSKAMLLLLNNTNLCRMLQDIISVKTVLCAKIILY